MSKSTWTGKFSKLSWKASPSTTASKSGTSNTWSLTATVAWTTTSTFLINKVIAITCRILTINTATMSKKVSSLPKRKCLSTVAKFTYTVLNSPINRITTGNTTKTFLSISRKLIASTMISSKSAKIKSPTTIGLIKSRTDTIWIGTLSTKGTTWWSEKWT